jgi:iron complex outermembrane receptor protein
LKHPALSFLASLTGAVAAAAAQGAPAEVSTEDLKKLSFEQLMDLEVTSVSRRAEKLSEAASAVQVITGANIRRSGATNLVEALRLAPNLQVAQVNASQWAVSARGFNNVLANKLLVLIDGRTVYTPFYAGVFWDVQDVVLEDVDRIEVVSGPGSALWGANAVNGVINVITKSSKETQGAFVEAGGGDEIDALASVRYGGTTKAGLAWRAYGRTSHRDDTLLHPARIAANDAWHLNQAGLRLDWDGLEGNTFTVQADAYEGEPNPDGVIPVDVNGGNVLARWQRSLSGSSQLQVQVYYDRAARDFNNGFAETLSTWDLDVQHSLQPVQRHRLIWGFGVRAMRHEVDNLELFGFTPEDKSLELLSAFAQDEIELRPDLLFTLGAKFEHNDYTGAEWQPSARLAWTLTERQTLWAAYSRAVRTPSRLDREFTISLAPGFPFLTGSASFDSEEVLAAELGWRMQAAERLSLSVATFHNDYDKIRSAEPGAGPLGLPITLGNGVQGDTYGIEISAVQRMTDWWQLRGGYTYLEKRLEVAPGNVDLNGATAESDDPEHQVLLQSTLDLPHDVEFDTVFRYVDRLPQPVVDSYVSLDARLAWRPTTHLELSLTGQNLLDAQHLEFLPSSPAPRQIERSVLGRATWRY